jgi:urease accessory protein
MRAWQGKQHDAVGRLNHWFVVSRESAELRAETVQMGFSLRQLLEALPCASPFSLEELRQQLANFPEIAYPVVWSGIATVWQIPAHPALTAYLWSWLENQVMAALKAVPLGQSAGQRLLFQGGAVIESVVNKAMQLPEAQWINVTPALAIASACHETQYSRLFRS